MTEKQQIATQLQYIWSKIQSHFNIYVPLKIHWTPVHTVRSATGSAITPDYILRSKKKISPHVNITIPDDIEWLTSHKENVKKILTHEILHFKIPKHTPETRKYGYNHNIDEDTYTDKFLNNINF